MCNGSSGGTNGGCEGDADAAGDEAIPPKGPRRVAVIGAGPSGLSALYAFHQANPDEVLAVAFEGQDRIGGQWNYDPRTGRDEHGLPIHSSMYPGLWSNGPKEAGGEYPDYTFLEHYGKLTPSFEPRAATEGYIKGRARKYALEQYVRFNTLVQDVEWDGGAKQFTLRIKELREGTTYTEVFDYVIVATGHFSVPEFPTFPGYDTFPGKLLHCKDFRNAADYKDLRVLVVGGSLSAEDIALQCYKFGAASVTITNRAPMGYPWPHGISEVPMLTHLEGSKAFFTGGGSTTVDVIFSGTGYKYHFPFLREEMRLKTRNVLYPCDLYKGVFWAQNPQLMYLGMQNQVYTFLMFELQAFLARDAVLGKFRLPARSDMLEDIGTWVQRQETLGNDYSKWISFQTNYIEQLNELTSYCTDHAVGCAEMFELAEEDKMQDMLTFRDKSFRSQFTDTRGVAPTKPWLKQMDDCALEAFMPVNGQSTSVKDKQFSAVEEGDAVPFGNQWDESVFMYLANYANLDRKEAEATLHKRRWREIPVPSMPLQEYTKLEQATLGKWGVQELPAQAWGRSIAPSVPVAPGSVVLVLPPYLILKRHEVTDDNRVIQVAGGGQTSALFSSALSNESKDCLLNHSCDPNLEAVILPDLAVHMVALRSIQPFEPLTWDYETTEEDLLSIGAGFRCSCNSPNCRGEIRGKLYRESL